MSILELFEVAVRENYMFQSVRGMMTSGSFIIQDLYKLSIPDLNLLADGLYEQKQSQTSRRRNTETTEHVTISNKLALVEHIIKYKEDINEANKNAKLQREKDSELLKLLNAVDNDAEIERIKGLSKEDRQKLIDEIKSRNS